MAYLAKVSGVPGKNTRFEPDEWSNPVNSRIMIPEFTGLGA